jgi:hypothetical protein
MMLKEARLKATKRGRFRQSGFFHFGGEPLSDANKHHLQSSQYPAIRETTAGRREMQISVVDRPPWPCSQLPHRLIPYPHRPLGQLSLMRCATPQLGEVDPILWTGKRRN